MLAILPLIVVLALSFLVTRVATVALTHTGLSTEVARFQARSALTGSGFTTFESERVVNHPVRRRILMLLMLTGNAGIITAVSSLILAFVGQEDTQRQGLKLFLLVGALVLLWALATSRWVDRRLTRLTDRALRRYTSLEVRDFASPLGLSGDYRIVETLVTPTHWLTGKTLEESCLREEGVLVLSIQRADGTFRGTPDKHTRIGAEDTLILYGHLDALRAIDERRARVGAEEDHQTAVARQQAREAREREEERDVSDSSSTS